MVEEPSNLKMDKKLITQDTLKSSSVLKSSKRDSNTKGSSGDLKYNKSCKNSINLASCKSTDKLGASSMMIIPQESNILKKSRRSQNFDQESLN